MKLLNERLRNGALETDCSTRSAASYRHACIGNRKNTMIKTYSARNTASPRVHFDGRISVHFNEIYRIASPRVRCSFRLTVYGKGVDFFGKFLDVVAVRHRCGIDVLHGMDDRLRSVCHLAHRTVDLFR